MNSCAFIGRLTDAPVIKDIGDKTVANFTLAVKRPHAKDKTDFIDFNVWGQGARYLQNYAEKGCLVSALGQLEQDTYINAEGNKRTKFRVICQEVSIITWPKKSEQQDAYPTATFADYEGDPDENPF